MKLYIAGHSQEDSNKVAKLCRDAGHFIMSSWLEEDLSRTSTYSDNDKQRIAEKDFSEVAASDALVLVASSMRIPGGKFVEAGIALGQGKPVYVLGHRENMLMWHPLCQRFDSCENFLTSLYK